MSQSTNSRSSTEESHSEGSPRTRSNTLAEYDLVDLPSDVETDSFPLSPLRRRYSFWNAIPSHKPGTMHIVCDDES